MLQATQKTLAFSDAKLIMAVKRFMIQALVHQCNNNAITDRFKKMFAIEK
jgi:hypothetical protein